MSLLWFFKIKSAKAIKQSSRAPPILCTIQPTWQIIEHEVNPFWTHVFLVSILKSTPNHKQLKYTWHPKKTINQIKHIYL